MPVISEPLADIAGAAEGKEIVFWTTRLRENDAGTGTVTTTRHTFYPVNGVLTTTLLDPGEARVRIGMTTYNIVLPDTSSTIRLWPLIDAGMPTPPESGGWVRNGGNVARIHALTEADYSAIVTPDPETLYIVIEP